MKVVVFAYHNIGCTGLRALQAAGFDIAAVFTHKDDPGEQRFFSSVAEWCAEQDLPVFAPEEVNHPLWIERIREIKPDLIFSFYYRDLLSQELLDIPAMGAYNLHGSLLPRYRGRAPANWVLVKGEKETGVTLHQMTRRPDAGAIVAQLKVMIANDETALSLHNKLDQAAAHLLQDILPRFLTRQIPLTPQDENQASYFGRRTAADGQLFWQRPAQELDCLIRAVTRPYPGAFT